MMQVAVALMALGLFQDAGPDRLLTATGEELQGEIVGLEPDGGLVLKSSTGTRTIALHDIRRIAFEDKPQVRLEKSVDRLWPRLGGAMTGSVVSIGADRVSLKCSHGTYSIRRDEVRGIALGGTRVAAKDVKEDQDLLLLAPEGAKGGEPVAVSGRIETLDGEHARVDGVDYPRTRVREIQFRSMAAREPTSGLFARVLMKNGDGLVGLVRKVELTRVQLFTHYAGVATIDKAAIHSIAMVPLARLQSGHLLVCEPGGVIEIDREGKRIWSYGEGAVGCTSARKLPNGNALIANSSQNRVFEVRPSGATGGIVVWSMDDLQYPCDAQRLNNGNILVAEYGASRVCEYDPKDKSRKWTVTANNPVSAERLEDGSTLVSVAQGGVVELDAKGAVRHRYALTGSNEYRATRTAEGTVLIADQRGTQIVEMDRTTVVWKYDQAPQPRMAIRLDDGNTMIFKRNGEIIEVDARGQTLRTFGRFGGSGTFSIY